jgi:hypothetical protein
MIIVSRLQPAADGNHDTGDRRTRARDVDTQML